MDKKITVIVTYTGNEDFVDEFPPTVPLSTVKTKAMHKFGLEPSSASKYALADDTGAHLPEKDKLSDLDENPVKLTLVFVEDQTKG